MNDINLAEIFDNVNYTLRIIGRVVFCLLLLVLYRLYKLFASPLMVIRNQRFVNLFEFSLIFSFFLFAVEYFINTKWMATITIGFNLVTVLVLVVYLYSQIYVINKVKAGNEFQKLSEAMDSLIDSLKKNKSS